MVKTVYMTNAAYINAIEWVTFYNNKITNISPTQYSIENYDESELNELSKSALSDIFTKCHSFEFNFDNEDLKVVYELKKTEEQINDELQEYADGRKYWITRLSKWYMLDNDAKNQISGYLKRNNLSDTLCAVEERVRILSL